MAEYSIIADVSKYLAGLLREKMCPDLIPVPAQIKIADPGERDQDYILGIFLYHIEEEKNAVLPRYRPAGQMALQQSPKPYRLHYMFFMNHVSRASLNAEDAQRIIGRAAQILGDQAQVQANTLQPWLDVMEPPVTLSQDKISLEEKFQIWQSVSQPYRLCLFYQAAPVLISSENYREISRVKEADFLVGHAEEGRKRS